VCKQFANKSSFEIQKTYKNTDDKYGEEVFSYEGGKEWVLRNYKDAVVQIYSIACY
jgi:ribosomal silencing factor RsfS